MNRKQLIGIATIAIMSGTFISGCSSDNGSTQKVAKKDELKESLAKQGYTITDIISYGDGANVVYLEKKSKKYVGTVDDQFKWLMEPTDKYEELEFHEGLAAVSIPEKRKMILAEHSEAKVWGFINPKGEMVIKPIYRNVHPFSDGVAIVETIEEDRDDFANSRTITIDKTGKEIGVLKDSHLSTEEENPNEDGTSYIGGYTYTNSGFYDKKGRFVKMNLQNDNYLAINGTRFENDVDENLEILHKSLNGKKLGTFKSNGEKIHIYDAKNGKPSTINQLAKNNVILVNEDEQSYLLDSSGLNILLRGKIHTDLAADYLFLENQTDENNSNVSERSGTFFDYNGKKVLTVNNMVGPLLNDRYFVRGNEYFTLVDMNGNILIDESKKITDIEVEAYNPTDSQYDGSNPFKNVVHIKFRENASDVDPNPALLNVQTLKILEVNHLLNHKTRVN